MKNHTRGNETRTESYGEFAGVSARTHVGDSNLGVPIRIELGLHVRGSFSRFKSRHTSKYAGDGGEIAGGVEAYFKHAPNGDFFPWWSMEIRLLYGYAKIRGKLSDNSYRATIKMNFVSLSGTFNILWPFKMSRRVADSRPEYRIIKIGGVQAGVCEGFFPKIELRWDWKIPTVVSKQSTATRQGLRDHAYERSFYGEVRLHFWKFVNDTTDTDVEALWEITFGPMGGLRWYQSNGRLTMTDGHSVYSYMYGAFITVTVNRTFGFEVVGFATLNTGGGEDVGGTLSLAAWW